MANEMPPSDRFSGLSRKVIQYSEAFSHVMETVKTRALTDADWASFEEIVATDTFERMGVWLGGRAERADWPTYTSIMSQYGGQASWEGTLRHITEAGDRVILELEERNIRDGETDVSNTVTIYKFDEAGKLRHLDVYVMPLGKRADDPAAAAG